MRVPGRHCCGGYSNGCMWRYETEGCVMLTSGVNPYLKHEAKVRSWLGVFVAFVGAAIISWGEITQAGYHDHSWLGTHILGMMFVVITAAAAFACMIDDLNEYCYSCCSYYSSTTTHHHHHHHSNCCTRRHLMSSSPTLG